MMYQTIQCSHDTLKCQDNLTAISKWDDKWEMDLNVSKCKILFFNSRRKLPHYSLHGHQLEIGLMWREVDDQGFLVNSFADTVSAKFPMYVVRGLGGVLYLSGALIMCWNMWRTIVGQSATRQPVAQLTPAE